MASAFSLIPPQPHSKHATPSPYLRVPVHPHAVLVDHQRLAVRGVPVVYDKAHNVLRRNGDVLAVHEALGLTLHLVVVRQGVALQTLERVGGEWGRFSPACGSHGRLARQGARISRLGIATYRAMHPSAHATGCQAPSDTRTPLASPASSQALLATVKRPTPVRPGPGTPREAQMHHTCAPR